jgi:tRNA pseudouridine55 synthase
MTSAVRIEGERLYRKAQRGEEVERPSRTVTIHGLRLVRFELPEADLDVTCSGGTYIRTLINDIGKALGCGAHMKTLRRTEAAGFTLEDAIPLEQLEPSHLRPVEDAARGLARVDLDQPAAQDVRHGRPLAVQRANAEGPRPVATEGLAEEGEPIAVFFDGKLLGVYRRSGERLVAERVMPE